jgi:hypothetical protein
VTADLVLSPEAAGRAVSRAGVSIYPVDARGLLPGAMGRTGGDATLEGPPTGAPPSRPGNIFAGPAAAGQPMGISTMQELAEETGGRAFVNTNDVTGAVRSAIDDGAVTYTLGFYVDSSALDDKFHDLKVRVKRSGVSARTQRGFFALKDVADNNPASAVALSVMSPLESPAIHISATLGRGSEGLDISGSIDLHDLHFEQAGDVRKGAVEIYLIQQDVAGAMLDRQRLDMQVNLERPQYEAYLNTGLVFRARFISKVPPRPCA